MENREEKISQTKINNENENEISKIFQVASNSKKITNENVFNFI
jgi:hypothetical protein